MQGSAEFRVAVGVRKADNRVSDLVLFHAEIWSIGMPLLNTSYTSPGDAFRAIAAIFTEIARQEEEEGITDAVSNTSL